MCEMGIAVSISCGECEKLSAMGKNMAAPSTPFSGPLAVPMIMMMMIVAISLLVELRKACSITINHLQKKKKTQKVSDQLYLIINTGICRMKIPYQLHPEHTSTIADPKSMPPSDEYDQTVLSN